MTSRTRAGGIVTLILAAALVVSFAGRASAQIPQIPVRISARTMAMGGAGLLSSNPIEMAHFNPGALSLTGGFHLYIPMIQFGGDDDLKDLVEYIGDNEDQLSNYASLTPVEQAALVNDINNTFSGRWVNMNVDPMIGIQMGKLAFSAYSVTRGALQLTTKPHVTYGQEPVIYMQASNDLVFNGGLGLQFGPFLHGGVGVRLLNRTQSDGITEVTFEDADGLSALGEELIGTDESSRTGMAIDAGATLTLTSALAVGGVIRNLYGSSDMDGYEWEPEISGGIRFKPLEILMGIPKFLIRDITLEADIQDITNTAGESYADKLQLGAEVKLPLWTAARIGLNRGQLSYGAGFHFLLLDLQVAKATLPTLVDDGAGGLTLGYESFYAISVGIGF